MWIETFIRYILWFVFFLGLWFIVHPVITPLFQKARRKSSILIKKESKTDNLFFKKVEQFLSSTINNGTPLAVYTFLFLLVLLGLLTMGGLYTNGRGIIESIMWGIITPFIPVIFLYFRLHSLRITISHEGKDMIQELLNNYRIHHLNMQEAIDQTIYSLGNKYPNSQKLLMRLAIGLREYQNEKELRKILDHLVYSINSKWAILLSNLIFIAVIKGYDIQEGLVDLTKDLSDLEHINEKNRQLNIEGGVMLKVLVPGVAIGGLYLLYDMFGFTLKQYIDYQFRNPIGFTAFYYTLVITLFTTLLYMFFRKEKNDF